MIVAAVLVLMVSMPVQAGPERSIAAMVNELRAKHGRAPLSVNAQLERAATAHANDMGQRGFFSHRGSDGSKVSTRARRVGYNYCRVGENIAKGQKTPQEAMTGWINSAPHRRNMLKAHHKHIGVVRGPDDTWVMVLAAPMGSC